MLCATAGQVSALAALRLHAPLALCRLVLVCTSHVASSTRMSPPIIVERLEDVEVDVLELRDRLFPGQKGCTWRARQWSGLFSEWSGQFTSGAGN